MKFTDNMKTVFFSQTPDFDSTKKCKEWINTDIIKFYCYFQGNMKKGTQKNITYLIQVF